MKFELILGMFFLKTSNADVSFDKKILMWKTYITNEALPTIEQVQIIDSKKLIIVTFDVNYKTFIMHVAIREQEKMPVHSKRQAQVGALLFDKASTKVLVEHFNNSNVFLVENIAKLTKNSRINEYTIKLEKGKQPLFDPIYSLGLVKLETLKTYIKINLANGFIQPSKSFAGALIFFDKKPGRSFRFYVDYWSFNNITIKN